MVRGVNKVILLGNTAAEPDFRVLANGTGSIASVGLATNESYRDQNGNLQEVTEWHRLVFWNKLAETVRDFCHKGQLIYVEGKIKTRSYEDQQGVKKYTTEIHVTELHLLSQKSGDSSSQAQASQGYPQQPAYGSQAPAYQQPAPAPYGYPQQAQPQGGYQQAPAYQQPAPAQPQGYPQQAQPQGYTQQRLQGSFRNAPPAGAVLVGPAQPAPAPVTPAAYAQQPAAAAAPAQNGNRPFKDDDLPF